MPGAFVISLDFELHWGVRDKKAPSGNYRPNLLGARRAIPRMLDSFERFGVAATWATVGFLFAESEEEMREAWPYLKPAYRDPALNPYAELIGKDEQEDPLHYAPSLIAEIRRRQRQEIATHTFSHYYCLEPGQSRETFAADLESALRVARRRGISIRSIVFPRNQVNPRYLPVLAMNGITCYRGNQSGWMHRARAKGRDGALRRAARLADHYVSFSGANVTPWNQVLDSTGLCNVPASMFLRPYSPRLESCDALRLRRIRSSIEAAATRGGIFHLWWHPHNFGRYTDQNLRFLDKVLQVFADCRDRYGMESLSMADVAVRARASAEIRLAGKK
ncbi:MAG: polysaccharide deacetylase family protein [Acidobacteriia bacterium]|nr:polysaccharide deacetylase family protein [Terriglobia bacterium]